MNIMSISKYKKHFDTGSLIIIAITIALFTSAWFTTGYSHSLLLEAGVFLVSLKLIMMSYNLYTINKRILSELDEIKRAIIELEKNA